MLLPHSALVLVVDGSRMQILRNRGQKAAIELEIVSEDKLKNPASHVMEADSPGRSHDSKGQGSHAYEADDLHQRREDEFVADALTQLRAAVGNDDKIVLIAPPKALGHLRKLLNKDMEARVVAEINKDLGHLKPAEIAAALQER